VSERLPLEGVRVADFCWLIAGPATTRVLADFGADVIKIESASRVDNIRTTGVQPPGPGSINTNGVFNDTNTNKRSITLNLNTPRGIELAKQIVARSDIVTNNFTGDRMDRWGLGYEELRRVKPDIIMLTMPVMGTTGPYVRYGSYGNGVIGYAGMRTNMGFPGRPPVGIQPLYSDFSVPYFAVSALMAALYHRGRTGEGQFIDLAQMESAVGLLGTDVIEYSANGTVPQPLGNRSRDFVPHGAYPCRGDDRWCAIAVETEAEWRALCTALGRPALADDPRFATLEGRRAHEDELDAILGAWTAERDAWEVMNLLQAAGVMAGVVEDLEDMLTRDPHLRNAHFEEVSRGNEVTFMTHRQPARLDGVSPPLRVSPVMGEHNEEIYCGLLGLSADEYAQLVADEVIY
jgi:benzylsuccinate CoA-transferase BbsF subunit